MNTTSLHRRVLLAGAVACAVLTACTSKSGGGATASTTADSGTLPGEVGGIGLDGDCVRVDMAVSPEKLQVLTDLAGEFNNSGAKVGGKCVAVAVARKSSGAGAKLLVDGWPNEEVNGPKPVVWSPSASGWAAIVNLRTGKQLAPPGNAFMNTPLVMAMPKPMADALSQQLGGAIGFKDIVDLAASPDGWAKYGHPEWGRFKLGKTNPNFSTSGLNFTIAEYYAATGKTRDLSVEDLNKATVAKFAADVESAVVHYGDTTLTFLNNWYRADRRGTALTYASAVAVEEKSIIDYNTGNPDGTVAAGERVPPKVPLVAIYPKEGTLFSDNPFIILNADWVSADEKAAAQAFEQFVLQPKNQQKVVQYGFRPGISSADVTVGAPLTAQNGVDLDKPDSELQVPAPEVLSSILDRWAQNRKTARVLLVVDVSGSMADDAGNGETKLDLAKRATIQSLDQFKDDDEVGLWVFSTDLDGKGANYLELLPVSRIGGQKEQLRNRIDGLIPTNGTPLYDVTGAAHEAMVKSYDDSKINAVVLLTDGVNDDGDTRDDDQQRQTLLAALRAGSEGVDADEVRVFTISYGADADKDTLKRIAENANAALYDASNPQTIEQVFTNVISNF